MARFLGMLKLLQIRLSGKQVRPALTKLSSTRHWLILRILEAAGLLAIGRLTRLRRPSGESLQLRLGPAGQSAKVVTADNAGIHLGELRGDGGDGT